MTEVPVDLLVSVTFVCSILEVLVSIQSEMLPFGKEFVQESENSHNIKILCCHV